MNSQKQIFKGFGVKCNTGEAVLQQNTLSGHCSLFINMVYEKIYD